MIKSLLLFTLLFSQAPVFAQTFPPDEPESILNSDSIGAIKAVMAKPKEAKAFNAGTRLTKVKVIHQSSNETVYLYEGKRLQRGAYRGLTIVETRGFVGDVGTNIYTAKLIP